MIHFCVHQLEHLKKSYEIQLTALKKQLAGKQSIDQSEAGLSTRYQMEPAVAQLSSDSHDDEDIGPVVVEHQLLSDESDSDVFDIQVTIPDFNFQFPEVRLQNELYIIIWLWCACLCA